MPRLLFKSQHGFFNRFRIPAEFLHKHLFRVRQYNAAVPDVNNMVRASVKIRSYVRGEKQRNAACFKL